MTTIAWDGKTLAADTQASSCGLKFRTSKIGRLKDGRLYGISGDADYGLAVVDWLNGGEKPHQADKDDWSTILVIGLDGSINRYERRLIPITVLEHQHAIGSGRDFAMAAMACGKTAKEAVEIASQLDEATGGYIETLALNQSCEWCFGRGYVTLLAQPGSPSVLCEACPPKEPNNLCPNCKGTGKCHCGTCLDNVCRACGGIGDM